MDLNHIRDAALAATPGPWYFGSFHRLLIVADGRTKHNPIADLGETEFPYNRAQQYADAAYIAAANPQVVLEMCNQIEELRQDAMRYRWLRDSEWNASSHPEVWVQVTNEYGELDAAIDEAMK